MQKPGVQKSLQGRERLGVIGGVGLRRGQGEWQGEEKRCVTAIS